MCAEFGSFQFVFFIILFFLWTDTLIRIESIVVKLGANTRRNQHKPKPGYNYLSFNMEQDDEEMPDQPIPKIRLNKDIYEDTSKPKLLIGEYCMPGQKICIANEYFEAGEGTYEFGNIIYASILGTLCIEEFPEKELTVVSVKREDKSPFVAPDIGAIVTCTVASRTQKLCRCLITHVGPVKLDEPIRGIIRREYIRNQKRDEAKIETSFGIGDTVLARVVSIGEGDFIMSTAEDTLGVANAISKAGYYMVPIGWTEMECPKTKERQPRKVAKIVQDKNLEYWHNRNVDLQNKS